MQLAQFDAALAKTSHNQWQVSRATMNEVQAASQKHVFHAVMKGCVYISSLIISPFKAQMFMAATNATMI